MQNLARLEFDKHLFLRNGPGAVSTLDIPAGEVKNRRPIEFDIPPHIARMLTEYRDYIVPRVMGRKPDRLFVNPDGTAKHPQTLSKLIRRIVHRYVGVDLRLISFATWRRKSCWTNSPGAFELVKQLLGHENLKTTVNADAGIDTRRACHHHFQLLEKMSADEPIPFRRSRRRRRPKSEKPGDKSGRN